MHFLTKLAMNTKLDNPTKNHMDVHRHFYKYSRGEFIGPALKISKTNTKITLKASHEYEDLIQEIVAKSVSNENFVVKGVVISGGDLNDTFTNLGLDWKVKRSTGQTINYKGDIDDTIQKNLLLEVIENLRSNSYLLLSFNINANCKVTTKKRIPQPSKKKMEDDDTEARIKFCIGMIENNERNLTLLNDLILPDFKSELTVKWKNILILNNYRIDDIELPKDLKDSRLLRIMAIRKGVLFRSIEVDGDLIEKQYKIIV